MDKITAKISVLGYDSEIAVIMPYKRAQLVYEMQATQ